MSKVDFICDCGDRLMVERQVYCRKNPKALATAWDGALDRAQHPDSWAHLTRCVCRSCFRPYWLCQEKGGVTFTRVDGTRIHLEQGQIIPERKKPVYLGEELVEVPAGLPAVAGVGSG